MLKLTPAESDVLRSWLISRMRAGGQTVSDKAPAEELDPDGSLGWNDGGSYQGLSRALFYVAAFEAEHGRPGGPGRAGHQRDRQLRLVPGGGQAAAVRCTGRCRGRRSGSGR
jgi:hypothetical protein